MHVTAKHIAALAVAFSVAGCNLVLGLEPTESQDPNNPFDPRDHDLDDLNNVVDNCPTLANRAQTDSDEDGVGDVCDPRPDVPGDSIAERTFFADSQAELDRWNTNEFVFEVGAASYLGDQSATLHSKRTYEEARVLVEVGFEIARWNPNVYAGGLRVEFDDIGGPSVTLFKSAGYMTLQAVGSAGQMPELTFFTPFIDLDVPIRMLAAYDRTNKQITGTVGVFAPTAMTTSSLLPGPFKIAALEVAVRLTYIVVYVGD